MRSSRLRIGLAALVAVPVGIAALAALPSASGAAGTNRTVLAGSMPRWAVRPLAAAVSIRESFGIRVYLQPRTGEAALEAAVAAVSTPGSPEYRHFISVRQYEQRYEPSAAEVGAVSRWLAGSGLRVEGLGAANRYVIASGTTAAVERAFGVSIRSFRYEGHVYQANAEEASVPDAVAGAVLGVVGLDTAPHLVTSEAVAADPAGQTAELTAPSTSQGPTPLPPPTGYHNARPCSAFYGQLLAKYEADFKTPLPKFYGKYRTYVVCGYQPSQLAGAYGASASGLTGKGVTVAITDAYASPTMKADAQTYFSNHGLPRFTQGQFVQSYPAVPYREESPCGGNGWFSEESLDVEAVHTMAPGADVDYYGAASCLDNDLADTLDRVVDQDKASIVTNSWGEPEYGVVSGYAAEFTQVFLQGAMQGIGFFFATGDDGDYSAVTGLHQAGFPASDPYVTAVGGTSTAIGPNDNIEWQYGWGTDKYLLSTDGSSWQKLTPEDFLYGSGGGFSSLFNEPKYQIGVVPATSQPGRAIPDVSMDADVQTGMLIGLTQTFPTGPAYGEYRIGGTSLASPLMAGVQALATQSAGGRLGFANPAIYMLARKNASKYFMDVGSIPKIDGTVRADYANGIDPTAGILYSVRTFGDDLGLQAAKGWDDVTGIGVPSPAYFTAYKAS